MKEDLNRHIPQQINEFASLALTGRYRWCIYFGFGSECSGLLRRIRRAMAFLSKIGGNFFFPISFAIGKEKILIIQGKEKHETFY